jgi:hypothetical protein
MRTAGGVAFNGRMFHKNISTASKVTFCKFERAIS